MKTFQCVKFVHEKKNNPLENVKNSQESKKYKTTVTSSVGERKKEKNEKKNKAAQL